MAHINTLMIITLLVFTAGVFKARAENEEIDDWSVQEEEAEEGEIEGDENMDLKFDLDITSMAKRPKRNKKLPVLAEVQRQFEEEKGRLMKEAEAAGDRLFYNTTVSVVGGFQYYNMFDWHKRLWKCCPRTWWYQCRSAKVSMPCFYTYNNGNWEWCCSFWPKVTIRRCSCCQCAVLTSMCAHQGQCRRRYSRKSFLAVCYRNQRWAYLRYMTKALPTSCYCRVNAC